MKTILVSLAAVMLLSTTVPVESSAKQADCLANLRQCGGACRETYGDFTPFTDGCVLGCAIGYLWC
jgi:hypothetical protein